MSQAVEFHHLTSGVANTARQAVIETQFVDDKGKPIDLNGGSSTPSAGSVTPASLGGYSSGTGHGKVVQVKADGSGFDFVAPVTAPTADTLTGATDTGKRVLKATDAAAARKAIGAGTSSFSGSYDDLTNKPAIPAAYTLPAATAAALGGVKQGAAVPDLAAEANTTTANAKINALLAQLRAAGVIAA